MGLESRCDSMIGSVRPKSSKRKAKGVPKPKHKKQVKLNNWLSGYAEARTVLAAKSAAHAASESAGPSSKRPAASSTPSDVEQAAARLKMIQAEAATKRQREAVYGGALRPMKLHRVAGS